MNFFSSTIIIIIFFDVLYCSFIFKSSLPPQPSSSLVSLVSTASLPSLPSSSLVSGSSRKAIMNSNVDNYAITIFYEKELRKLKTKIKNHSKNNFFERKKRKTVKSLERDQIATTNTHSEAIALRTTTNTMKPPITATIKINTYDQINALIENNYYYYYYDSHEKNVEMNQMNSGNIETTKNRIGNPVLSVRATYSPIGATINVGVAQLRQVSDLKEFSLNFIW